MEHNPLYLDAIVQWNMTPQEAEAFKMVALYESEFRSLFGDSLDGQTVRRNSIPKRGDPRKSNIFRQCWKMLRNTRGLIDPHDYKLYIRGNLTILKLKNAHVEPNCITGDKAWVRYKVWRRYYDRQLGDAGAMTPAPSVTTTDPKIIGQIDRTKHFLFEKCGGSVPSFLKIKEFIGSGIFRFWVASSKISQFYVALSPFVAAACNVEDLAKQCGFSLALIREKMSPEIGAYFQHEFSHEYANEPLS